MTTNVITVSADAPLQDVVRTMERRRVKRVPIVSDGKIVGIISRANVVQALARLVDELPESRGGDEATRCANPLVVVIHCRSTIAGTRKQGVVR